MASASPQTTVLRQAPGYFLYLPPTPIRSRFVMLEETSMTFYDVDTETARLNNPTSWETTGLSPSVLGQRPAIVFPAVLSEESKNTLRDNGYEPEFMVGKLVSIERQDGRKTYAKVLGKVNVKPLKRENMSCEGLEEKKGAVLPDEMRNGLLGRLWGPQDEGTSGGGAGATATGGFVTPREKLDKMPRKWHVDPAVLSEELEGKFAAGKQIQEGEVHWVLEEN